MAQNTQTPVLFLIFNRPDTTKQVFEAIRQARPARLYIAADGPRDSRPNEPEICQKTRAIVADIDWPCEVFTRFREKNLGCKMAVSDGITWFFENEEEGIILEDDCLPSPSFFTYCGALLEKYRNDDRVMHISGDGQANGVSYGNASYYFSPFPLIWGWATWRRAWNFYSNEMASYAEFRDENRIKDLFSQETYQQYWQERFDSVYYDRVDTWDFRWVYAVMSNNGLCTIPNTNLVTNIGFGADATHTTTESQLSYKERGEIKEVTHPQIMLSHSDAIEWIMQFCFFTRAKESPLRKYALYRFAQRIYGKMLGN